MGTFKITRNNRFPALEKAGVSGIVQTLIREVYIPEEKKNHFVKTGLCWVLYYWRKLLSGLMLSLTLKRIASTERRRRRRLRVSTEIVKICLQRKSGIYGSTRDRSREHWITAKQFKTRGEQQGQNFLLLFLSDEKQREFLAQNATYIHVKHFAWFINFKQQSGKNNHVPCSIAIGFEICGGGRGKVKILPTLI